MTSLIDRGEGDSSVMGAIEAAPSMLLHHRFGNAAKRHDTGLIATPDNQGTPLSSIVKRSLKRAHRRALQQGFAWYKGRCYAAADFSFMPLPQPPATTTTQRAWTQYNRRHRPRRRVSCLQWNCSGLSSSKLDELKTWLHVQGVQIITLVETRWTFTSEWVDDAWIHLHSGSIDGRGKGILVLIARDFCNANDIRWQEIEVGRLLQVRIPTKSRPLDLVAMYQHVDVRSPQCLAQREAIWHKFDNLLGQVPHRNLLLAMGDYNCNLPECGSFTGSEWYKWRGHLTKGSQHQDSGRLMSILRFHGLTGLNTWRASDGPTFVHAGSSSRIDFACTRKSHVDCQAKRPTYLWDAPFTPPTQQGHVPILHQIALYWTPPAPGGSPQISKQQCQQAKLDCQQRSSQWDQFLHASAAVFTTELTKVSHSDVVSDQPLSSFHSAVNECFHEHFPPMSTTVKPTPWKQSLDVILTKWQHRARLKQLTSCTGSGVFRAWHHMARFAVLKRQHRKHAAKVRRLNFCDILHSAQIAANRHDMHQLFRIINSHSPKAPRRRIQLRNSSGAIATPAEELDILRSFVEDVWGGPRSLAVSFDSAPGVPFSVAELAAALSRIPQNKAVASPFAPGIAWRANGLVLADHLYPILESWWSQNPPYIPRIWKDAWMLLIGKPQKPPSSPYNLRALALQEPLGKCLVGLLIAKANSEVRPSMQPWPIWAYLPKRSVIDAIYRVAQHCFHVHALVASQRPSPHARAAGVPKYQVCGGMQVMLDLERAFDGVARQQLFSRLQSLGISSAVSCLLTHWHVDTHYHLQHGHDMHALPTGGGLRQGCKAAPTLWNCLLLLYLQRASELLPHEWLKGHMNLYADDYHIGGTYYSELDLSLLLQAFGILLEVLKEFQLRLNPRKSVALLALAGTSHRHVRARLVVTKDGVEFLRIPLPSADETLIPLQQQANYLGTIMTYKDCANTTLRHRVALARIAQRRLGRWIGTKQIFRVQQRFQLWRTCVFPVLCHGLFATGINDSGIKQLQQVMYPMLRQIACDHAYRTGHTNRQALQLHHIPTPLQLLRTAANQLLKSVSQRSSTLPSDDITLQLSWTPLQQLIDRLNAAQDLGTTLVEPSSLAQALYQCNQCDFATSDVSVFRRHCTAEHGMPMTRTQMAPISDFSTDGLPTCKHCHKSFTTWRSFAVHVERGCEAILLGPRAFTSLIPPATASTYMVGSSLAAHELAVRGQTMLTETDLQVLRQSAFGHQLCNIVERRAWRELEREHVACEFLRKHCILCNHQFNRLQDLNAHYRLVHGQFWEGVPTRATVLTNTWASERPCPYCGALFKNHTCPVWVQVAVLLLFGAGPVHPDEPAPAEASIPLRCEVCLDPFSTSEELVTHLQTAHQLQGLTFNLNRDSVAGEPACSHCGALYTSIASLRSHIVQGRCGQFSPYAVEDSLPVESTWIEACTLGTMKIVLGQPMERLRLTTRCQMCGVHYSRAADLAGHLQGAHPKLWRQAQQLTMLLVSLMYTKGTCTCNPSTGQRRLSHVCLPLRQLSMLFCKMEGKLFAPFQVSESILECMLSRQLDRGLRFRLEQVAASRSFDQLWQAEDVLAVLRRQCIYCALEMDASALCQHLREAHPGTHPAVSFYIGHLTTFMMKLQLVDYQCYACQQIFNLPQQLDEHGTPAARQKLAQSHLLHNCPCLLQVALFLTGLINDGRFCDEPPRSVGSTADPGHLQGPGPHVGSTTARSRATGAQSKRIKTIQAGPSPDATSNAGTAPEPGSNHPTSDPCATVGPPGPKARQRPPPVPPHGQLRAFFQQGANGGTQGPDAGHGNMARAEEVVDLATDDPAPAPLPNDGSRSPGQGDEDLRSPIRGCSVEDLNRERSDSAGWLLAIPGVGGDQAMPGAEQEAADLHEEAPPVVPGVGRCSQRAGPCSSFPEPAQFCREPSGALETPDPPQGGKGDRLAPDAGSKLSMDLAWNSSQATQLSAEQPGGLHPALDGRATEQGQRQGEGQAEAFSLETAPELTILMHVLSHLRLQNRANWCFANSTMYCVMWALMTVQCEPPFLGERFAEMIQFLPCHNLQLVALDSLGWFQQILQTWGPFQGSQQGRQHDTSEFTAAVLTWLQAPAINMTWEKRLDENETIRAFDKGGQHVPLVISFPDTHAHLMDFEFTLSDLLRRWMQADGMRTALLQAPQLLCVHLDRFFQTDSGEICKSVCQVNMDTSCELPVFTGPGMRCESVSYELIASSAHLGEPEAGHFRSILKIRPMVGSDCNPVSWILTEDNIAAVPMWKAPDWFRACATTFWLVRSDCFRLHVYMPLPAADVTRDEMEPTAADTDSHASHEMPHAVPDATEEAILALLQATNPATLAHAYPEG
eukprot:s396_g31.t1